MLARPTLALGGLLALSGCGQPPAFEVSWEIMGSPQPNMEYMAQQCSAVGIFSVRVTVQQAGAEISSETHPCFRGSADGPPLEPGEYTVEVEGLRRNGGAWDFDPDVDTERIAYATADLVVSEGALPNISVKLLAPPQCDDGIDNDLDGTVDDRDPGCDIETAMNAPLESNDADLTLFQLSVTFLQSSVVKPYNVGVSTIRLELNGEVFVDVPDYQLDLSQWPFRMPLMSAELDAGTYTFTATAVGPGGAVTQPIAADMITVQPDAGGYVIEQFDFDTDLFLQPIIQPIALAFLPDCNPGGVLELDRMWIRVVDQANQPLDATTLGLTGTSTVGGPAMSIVPVDEAGGWVSFECPSSIVHSAALPWGTYRIESEGRLAADTCYAGEQVELAPQPVSAETITLERELDMNGKPVCPECSVDTDCKAQVCSDDGLCVDKEPGQ